MNVEINREALCSVVGFSGEITKISYTVNLTFKVGTYTMPTTHKFAIVDESIMPHCLLLELDILTAFEIDIDLKFNCCKHNDFRIADLSLPNYSMNNADSPVLLLEVENKQGCCSFSGVVA